MRFEIDRSVYHVVHFEVSHQDRLKELELKLRDAFDVFAVVYCLDTSMDVRIREPRGAACLRRDLREFKLEMQDAI